MEEELRDQPLSLRWKGDRVDGVFVAADWRESTTPAELVEMVVTRFREVRGGSGATWRSRVRLKGIPLEQMSEFVAAVRAARQESPIDHEDERRTAHFTSRWRGGLLLSISADTEWLADANRQTIADELVDLLDTPPQGVEGPRVTWLMRMMEEADA